MHKLFRLCLLLPVCALPLPAAAQSVESCMQSSGREAIDICSSTLDSGSRNENVFYKLASELYQSGDATAALAQIDKGLQIHPDSTNLTRLKSYVEIDSTEAIQLEQSAKKNQSVLRTGKLKIICRTKHSNEGLQACREYLSRTNVDKNIIEERMAKLEKELEPSVPKPPPAEDKLAVENTDKPSKPVADKPDADKPVVDKLDADIAAADIAAADKQSQPPLAAPDATQTQAPEPVGKPDDNQIALQEQATTEQPTVKDNNTAAVDQARSALKELVFDVQSSLLQLGFDAGAADGIAGARTRQALTSFYQQANIADNEFSQNGFISDSTLLDLVNAIRNREVGQRLLTESQAASADRNYPLALLKLNKAEQASPFISAPGGYRQQLTEKILADRKTGDGSTTTPIPQPTPAPGPGSTQTAQLDNLLEQIKRLENKMNLQEKALQDSFNNIGNASSGLRF